MPLPMSEIEQDIAGLLCRIFCIISEINICNYWWCIISNSAKVPHSITEPITKSPFCFRFNRDHKEPVLRYMDTLSLLLSIFRNSHFDLDSF